MINLVAISPFPPNITGISQYGYHISRNLAQSGLFKRITVLAGAQSSKHSPVGNHPSLSIKYAWQPDRMNIIPAILTEIKDLKPDLVWYNLGASVFGRSPLANLMGFMSLSLVKSAGIPTLVTLHELVELTDLTTLRAPGGIFARQGAHLLTHLATQADVVCLTMRRYVNWFSIHRPKVSCVHIPIGAYRKPEILPELDSPALLVFTMLAPFKGLEILLAAYRSLLPFYPSLKLTIAGTEHPRFPGYENSLRNEFGSIPGLSWPGQVPEDQVPALFSRAQIVVLPYTATTGSSSVMYQSAALGRAMVASDLPEIRSVANERGLEIEYFKNRDVAGLAKAIQSLLDSPGLRKTQLMQNYRAIQTTPPEETARLYIQAFNQALAAHDRPERIPLPRAAAVESGG